MGRWLSILGFALLILWLPGQEKSATLGAAPATGQLATRYRVAHAIVIGINKYAQMPSKSLSWAVADAQEIERYLTSMFGFEKANITLLLDGQASKAGIESALSKLADGTRFQENDCVLIYFSGHGSSVSLPGGGTRGFLIPSDANVNLDKPKNLAPFVEQCIPMRRLWELLDLCASRHALVVVDACYSGDMTAARGGNNNEFVPILLSKKARQVITAGTHEEEAFEDPTLGHGTFTFELLREMKRRGEEGTPFTAGSLYESIFTAVNFRSKQKQTPQYRTSEEGQVVFLPVPNAKAPAAPLPSTQVDANSTRYIGPLTEAETATGVVLNLGYSSNLKKPPTIRREGPRSIWIVADAGAKLPSRIAPSSDLLESIVTRKAGEQTIVEIAARQPITFESSSKPGKLLLTLGTASPRETPKGATESSRDLIVLDPGHGGHDLGASWTDEQGLKHTEKSLTFDISRRLGRHLTSSGYNVVYTRKDDTFVPLLERPKTANVLGAQAFVSLHINTSLRPTTSGIVAFYHKANRNDELFASCLAFGAIRAGGIPLLAIWSDTRVYQSGMAVLRHSQTRAALLELGFMSSPADRKKLALPEYREKLAAGIAFGLTEYMSGLKGAGDKPPLQMSK